MTGETFTHTCGKLGDASSVKVQMAFTPDVPPPKPVTMQEEVAAIRRTVEGIRYDLAEARKGSWWIPILFLVVLTLAALK